MRSPMQTLFTQALGFSTPWRVVSVDFKPGEGLIAFQVESTAKRATCPVCGAGDQPFVMGCRWDTLKDAANWTKR
jgi:transposase